MSGTDQLTRFSEGVKALASLLDRGAARILFGPFGGTQIELLETHPAFTATLEPHGLESDELAKVAREAANVLYAVLSGASKEDFVDFAASRNDDDIDPEDLSRAAAEAAQKFELVGRELAKPAVAGRQWLKRTAHEAVISTVSWEVWTKHGDSEGKAPGGPVAGASLALGTLALGADIDDPEQTVAVVLDEVDIDYLVDTLARLKEALVAMQSESHG